MNGNGTETDYIRELTALYALGALGQHEARAFEALMAEDDHLAAELRACESVVASLALDAPEAEPPAAAREKLMARIAGEKQPASIAKYATTSPAMNAALRGIFHIRTDEGEWVSVSPGIEAKILFEDQSSGSVSTLLRMKPGAEVIRHRHFGVEECLVLEGDFHIGDETYGPGDFQCALPGSIHDRVYTDGGALVLIISGGFEILS